MGYWRLIIAGLLALALFSCSKNELDGRAYMEFVEDSDNHLKLEKQMGELRYIVQYLPTEYQLMKEYKTTEIGRKLVNARKQENDSMLFFKLRILQESGSDVLKYNVASEDDYYERLQYLSYGLEENIAVVNNNDTIFPALFHFERTYGVAPFADFMLGFHTKIKSGQSIELLFDDQVFNGGILKFHFDKKYLENLPTLKLN